MKKILIVTAALLTLLSGCLPAVLQPETTNPTPISEADLQSTAAVISQKTLQSLPTQTVVPSETPLITTATQTPTQGTPTETLNPILLTLTATLGTGTVTANLDTPGIGTLPFTGTPNPAFSATATIEAQPLSNGTLPPDLAYGYVTLVNKAKVDVYISLRCVTKEGYVTILEYPVKSSVDAWAPAGKYTYVAWVGGRQFTGAFSLAKDQDLLINIFKGNIAIK